MRSQTCVLCSPTGESVIWSDARCRVLHVADAKFAGFCRVVWNAHVAEFTDLDHAEQAHVMRVVAATENALRKLLSPDKINLASLGNLVPHLHWHVIPRYRDDSHYPESIWAEPQRSGVAHALPANFTGRMKEALHAALG